MFRETFIDYILMPLLAFFGVVFMFYWAFFDVSVAFVIFGMVFLTAMVIHYAYLLSRDIPNISDACFKN